MSDEEKEKHWVWSTPKEDLYPLGDEKLKQLSGYVLATTWQEGKKTVPSEKLVEIIQRDRKYASQLYIEFKDQVENWAITSSRLEAHRKSTERKEKAKKVKPKKGKKKSAKEQTAPLAIVIDFSTYKKNKAG